MNNFSCLFTILNFSCFYITFQPSAVCLHFSSNFSCNFLTNFRDFCPHIEKSLISLPCTVAHLSTNMPDNFLDASSNVFLPLRTLPDDLICDRLSSIFCCCSLGKMPKGNSEMGIILLDPNAGPPLLTYHKLTTNVSEIKKSRSCLRRKFSLLCVLSNGQLQRKRPVTQQRSNLVSSSGLEYAKERNVTFCAKNFCFRGLNRAKKRFIQRLQ